MIGERERVTTKANAAPSFAPTRKGEGGVSAVAPRMREGDGAGIAAPSGTLRGFQFEAISIFPTEREETATPLEEEAENKTPAAAGEPEQKEAASKGKKKRGKAKEVDAEQAAMQSIHQQLKTGIFDWRVTPKEANQVLKTLLALEPVALFRTVQVMQYGDGDAWRKFMSHVTPSDGLATLEFKLNPVTGLLMRGDVIRLEVSSGAKSNSELSRTYTVTEEGFVDTRLPAPIAIIGLTPYQAVNAIGQAYIDNMVVGDPYLELVVTERGSLYPREAQTPPEKEWSYQARALPNTPEGKQRAKFQEYHDYIKAVTPGDPHTATALIQYYHWIEENKTSKEFGTRTPEDLWRWALEQAYKQPPVSKLEPYYRIADWMSAKKKVAPPDEQKRLVDALLRFDTWLDTHANDPKLDEYDATDIWVQAYRGAIKDELDAEKKRIEMEAMKEAIAPRVDWDKASKKLDEALRFLMTRVYQMPVPRTVKARETMMVNEAGKGEPVDEALFEVDMTYLLEGSRQEQLVRQKMGGDFLDSVMKRMTDPEFTTTTVEQDFFVWLGQNPARLFELQAASAIPEVTQRMGNRDVPTWQRVTDTVILMVPYLGLAAAGYEVVMGEDLFGHNLGIAERGIVALGALLPYAGKLKELGGGALSPAKLAKEFKLSTAQSKVLMSALTKIEEGSAGNKLLTSALEKLNKGAALSKSELSGLEKLAKEMGLADEAAAIEFTKGVSASEIGDVTRAQLIAQKASADAQKKIADDVASVETKLTANKPVVKPTPAVEPFRPIQGVPSNINEILKKGNSATAAEWQTVKKYTEDFLQLPPNEQRFLSQADFLRLYKYLSTEAPDLTTRAGVSRAVELALPSSTPYVPPELVEALGPPGRSAANDRVLRIFGEITQTQQNPSAYGKTFGEIWERAQTIAETNPMRVTRTGQSPLTLAMVDMLAERGVKIEIVTGELLDGAFKSTIIDPGAAILDLAFRNNIHGISPHMLQFLAIDDVLRALPNPTTMKQFLIDLGNVTGREGLADDIWFQLFDRVNESNMTSPDKLRRVLLEYFPDFE